MECRRHRGRLGRLPCRLQDWVQRASRHARNSLRAILVSTGLCHLNVLRVLATLMMAVAGSDYAHSQWQ